MLPLVLSLFLVTSAADSVTTYQAIGRGAREANPVLNKLSPAVFLSLKSGVAVGVSVLAIKDHRHRKPILIILGVMSIFQASVAVHNHHVHRGR